MRSIRAIFMKQTLDMLKNLATLVQFAVFPIVAFVMTELVAKGNDDIPDGMFVTQMASVFTGMILVTITAGIIAEDRDKKSLRLLVMAGVKPYEYLIGIGGVVFSLSAVVCVIFGLVGRFTSVEFAKFIAVTLPGAASSVLLGATVGVFSKNQQSATAISMPIAMVLGFGPMIAMFNETAEKLLSIFYTQQMNVVVNDFSASIATPILVILANIAVLTILFTLAYRKRGLRSL